MTYPDNPQDSLDADGAFVIGGGDYRFGQEYNEEIVKDLFRVPAPTLGNALDILRGHLFKLPLEVLQQFSDLIPDVVEGAFNTVAGAVDAIMGAINNFTTFLRVDQWDDWILDTFNFLSTQVRQVFEIVVGAVVTPIDAAVQGFKDWWTDLTGGVNLLEVAVNGVQDLIQNVMDAIITGLRGVPFVGAGLADLVANLTGYRQQNEQFQEKTVADLMNQQNAAISIVTQGYRNPAWVCRYPVADVTYPECFNSQLSIFGSTGPASAGTEHTHIVNGSQHLYAEPARWSVNPNQRRGAVITVSNTTVFDTVAVMACADSLPVTDVFLEVFRLEADGGMTLVSSSDVAAELSELIQYIERPLTTALIAHSGDQYVVCIRNAGESNPILRWRGAAQMGGTVDTSMAFSGTALSTKTRYTAAEVATALEATSIQTWAMLAAKNLGEDAQSFSDDFNRPLLGSLWVPTSSSTNYFKLQNGRAHYSGGGTGWQQILYTRRCASSANRVDGNLAIVTKGFGTHPRCGLLMHCDPMQTQQVYLGVNADNAVIMSGTPSSMTQRASHGTGGSGDWSMYYDADLDSYIVLKDGEPTGLEWAGVGATVKHGREYQYGGVRIERSQVDVFNTHSGGTVDDWTLRDWVPETPVDPEEE
ncbi:putative minor tail protein [Mycobacterium phage PP]|uniref:Putative minor tail protein n=1 Tax=Mycobacterium phage PP TaxID=2077134 RepID=A0A2Z5XVF2_9CAUD|nr:minor tail protein [Mycobacterium phage PP]BBC53834.1 putative minor tail protein [Mycobacterium phage PP]